MTTCYSIWFKSFFSAQQLLESPQLNYYYNYNNYYYKC